VSTGDRAPRNVGQRSKAGRLFDRVARSRPIPGNLVTFQHDPATAYEAMLEVIVAARRWVHFDNYIFRDDRIGQRFADALAERATAGVAVRVMTDWLGSFGTSRRFWNRLRDAGVEVRIFGPPSWSLVSNLSRNHRKLVVADGAVAMTGGVCIGDEWLGDPERGQLPWRDSTVRIAGPAAVALDQAFAQTWAVCGSALPDDEQLHETPKVGDAEVRVLAGEPGRSRLSRIAMLNLATATDRVWITDAYMVAPSALTEALNDAVRDDVDVRILVPGTSDLPVVRNLTRIGYRPLLEAGVRIFEWSGPMLHAKTAVTDGRWVRIGSTNLNWSSLLRNWELDVIIEHPAAAAELERVFRRDLAQSAEVQVRAVRAPGRIKRLLPAALALGAPEDPPPHHQPGRLERRRRRLIALGAVVASARRGLFGTVAIILLGLAILAFVLPRAVGVLFGLLSLVLALLAGRGAFRG
jgi:cardiolipin synthase A/B